MVQLFVTGNIFYIEVDWANFGAGTDVFGGGNGVFFSQF